MVIQQQTRNSTFAVSSTSTQICEQASADNPRTQLIITPTTAGVTVTIAKGNVAAVSLSGTVLLQNQPFVEATDGGYTCWQGPVQAVATGPGAVAITESFMVPLK